MHIRKTKRVLYIFSNIFPHHIAYTFLPQSFDVHHFTTHIYPSHYTPLSPLPYAALHYTSLHFTSLHYTSLHFFTLLDDFHFISFHYTFQWFSAHFIFLQLTSIIAAQYTQPVYCAATTSTYREWRYQMLYTHNLTSWWWAQYRSKHVEECNITRIKKICAFSWYLVNSLYRNARSKGQKVTHTVCSSVPCDWHGLSL